MSKVIVYSTSWCGYCHAAMDFLREQGVEFEDKDIEADQGAYSELLEKMGGNHQGVPVIDFDGEIILGFNRPKLMELIEKRNSK